MNINQLLILSRPKHWVKNLFVFVGLMFGHAWSDPELVVRVVLAFLAFCSVASFVYVLNDLADIEADRLHPVKRQRPLASGAVSPATARVLAAVWVVAGMALAWAAGAAVWGFVLAYGLMNIAYSLWLKHVVILDVFIIATGFMLRLLAGTLGVGIEPSKWLIICGLMVTLFLGFAKRRAELSEELTVTGQSGQRRKVLKHYSIAMLDKMIGIVASGTIVTYSLYTMAPETIAVHHTDQLVYTVPLVMYAMFRYLYILHGRGQGEDPATDLFRDPHILAAALLWAAVTFWVLR